MYDPGTGEYHAYQHLLFDPSPDVRRGCEQHPLDERGRLGDRLAQYPDVRARRGMKSVRRGGPRSSWIRTGMAGGTPGSSRTRRRIPAPDTRYGAGGFYAVAPARRTVRCGGPCSGFPGALVRLEPGSAPDARRRSSKCTSRPWNAEAFRIDGYSPRGMDIDRNGVCLGGSGERAHGQLRPAEVPETL